jgi:energy-converting hydrogenase Eha subunit E
LSITADAIAHTELSRVGLWVIFIFYPIALLIAFLAILASMTYLYLKIRYNQKFKKKGAGRS